MLIAAIFGQIKTDVETQKIASLRDLQIINVRSEFCVSCSLSAQRAENVALRLLKSSPFEYCVLKLPIVVF